MTTLYAPTSRLTAVGWLIAAVPGFTAAMVGTKLPQDPSKWTATGFVEVGPVVGGTPEPLLPVAKPVVSVHCWGVNGTQAYTDGSPNPVWSWSNKPPWARTAQLCEQIRAAALATKYSGPKQVAMPTSGYAHAYVSVASLVSEPREVFGDVASYAHYVFDLEVIWTPEAI